jgi:ribosomal protein S18 acetylase RimI-like enzyme
MKIRATRQEDITGLQLVLDETGLFPRELLPDLAHRYLFDDTNSDVWLTADVNGKAVGFCYATTEKLTDRVWNMLAIAVLPGEQGKGVGSEIIRCLETGLRNDGQRALIADTSGTEEFDQTRTFYRKNGYTEVACIKDFWAAGNDKITFWKSLA